jgi:hypothetical protein
MGEFEGCRRVVEVQLRLVVATDASGVAVSPD